MNFSFATPSALDYFSALVASDHDFALLEAAVSIAQDEDPTLDVQAVLTKVDGWQARVQKALPDQAAPLERLRVLNRVFYKELGFAGNPNDYYAPDNSFLHRVVHTRRGLPISLALLWLELAAGIGLRARGVGFPGHFLVKVQLPLGQAVLDPLTGQSLSRERLSELLEPFRNPNRGAHDETPLGLYLQPCAGRDMLARMLRNLKEIYKSRNDWQRLLAVQERLIVLLPECWVEVRDRGLAHAELGRTEQALADLECYLLHADDLMDSDAVADWVDVLRKS